MAARIGVTIRAFSAPPYRFSWFSGFRRFSGFRTQQERNVMQSSVRLSRRRLFEMVGAAGALAFAGGARGAWGQSGKRIERMAPGLNAHIDSSPQNRELAPGFGGDIGPARGPGWVPEGRRLPFNALQD